MNLSHNDLMFIGAMIGIVLLVLFTLGCSIYVTCRERQLNRQQQQDLDREEERKKPRVIQEEEFSMNVYRSRMSAASSSPDVAPQCP